jgi:hypothetical protein
MNDLPLLGEIVRLRRPDAGGAKINPSSAQDERLELIAPTRGCIETMTPTDGAQFIPAKLTEQGGHPLVELRGEALDELLLGARSPVNIGPQSAAKIEQSRR